MRNFVLTLMALLCIATISVGAATLAGPKPALYYSFDDENDIGKDLSGNGYDLTAGAGNNDMYIASGAVDGAADFDGVDDSFVATGFSQSDYVTDGSFTIACWAKLKSTANQMLGGYTNNVYGKNGMIFGVYGASYRPLVYGVKEDGVSSYGDLASGYVPTDEWTHYTAMFVPEEVAYTDLAGNISYKGTFKTYVNGVFRTSKTLYFKCNSDLGFIMSQAGWMINGSVDDMAMWGENLSDAQIKDLYDKTVTPMTLINYVTPADDTPALYYTFDDPNGIGGIGKDYSGWGYDLTAGASNNDMFIADGAVDGAVDFDGVDDYFATAGFSQTNHITDGSFTIACWAKLRSTVNQQLGGMDSSVYGKNGMSSAIYSNAFRPLIYGVKETGASSYGNLNSGHAPTDDWTHYAAVFVPEEVAYTDLGGNISYKGTYKTYVNGVYKTSAQWYYKCEPSLGFQMSRPSWRINGSVDEMALWGKSLTDMQIKALYDKTATPMTVTDVLPDVPGDANGDRIVDITDFSVMADQWGNSPFSN